MSVTGLNAPGFSTPRFGKQDPTPATDTQEELLQQLKANTETLSDIEFQRQLHAMPLDDLFVSYGQLQGQKAVLDHAKKGKVPTQITIPVQTSPFAPPQPVSVSIEQALGTDPDVLDEYRAGFNAKQCESVQGIITTLGKRTQLILDELRSRLTIAEGLGRDEVPYQPGDKKEDKTPPGMSVGTIKNFLSRAEC